MTNKERLDVWWATEPFGWDHPDTYAGILALLEAAEADRNCAESEKESERG